MKYFWFNILCGSIHEVEKGGAFRYSIVVETPSEEAFWKVAKKTGGECAHNTSLTTIEMNVRRKFEMGDPVEFWGTPRKVVIENSDKYLRIELTKDISIYAWIYLDGIRCIEPIK